MEQKIINVVKKEIIIERLEKKLIKAKSKWAKAVLEDAIDLVDMSDYEEFIVNFATLQKQLLCGAKDWKEYSWGGCALCYNQQIAEYYCTPSELKKTKGGLKNPNKYEFWLDIQARALYQASYEIWHALFSNYIKMEGVKNGAKF